jgi:pyruvate/2-oxoacid:ferredoxin oxidoreductase beta subunit
VKLVPLAALLLALAFIASACEIEVFDKDKKNLKKACPAAPATVPRPASLKTFPDAQGIRYTGSEQKGPSTVVTGFLAAKISPAHQAYHDALANAAGYEVTKEEQDAADSEVNFSGHGTSGQVKMLQSCKARTTVTITIRPS